MRLAFKNLKLGSRNTAGENFGLWHVVAATDIRIPADDKRRHLHLAKPVGCFVVMPRDAKLKVFRQLGVSGPSRFIKSPDAIRMALAKVGGKVRILGITDIECRINPSNPISIRSSTRKSCRPGIQSAPVLAAGPEAAGGKDEAFDFPWIIQCHRQRNASRPWNGPRRERTLFPGGRVARRRRKPSGQSRRPPERGWSGHNLADHG